MKHEVDLNEYKLRTDLLIDDFNNISEDIIETKEKDLENIVDLADIMNNPNKMSGMPKKTTKKTAKVDAEVKG